MSFRKLKPFQAFASYQFKDPDTGLIQKAPTLTELYKNIVMYRVQNKLEPIERLDLVVENYLCSLPENNYKCTGYEMHRSLMTYVRGGVALLKNIFYKKFATQDVAEKRAAQCVKCPRNVFPDRSAFMTFVDESTIQQVGERKTSLDKELAHCDICKCVLRAKVHWGDTLPAPTEEEMTQFKEVSCWQIPLFRK